LWSVIVVRLPFSPLYLLLFIAALGLLVVVVQVGAITFAFDKLGLSVGGVFLLLFGSLFGSLINLPLFSVQSESPVEVPPPTPLHRLLQLPVMPFSGRTIVAINVGGGLVPIFFSLYLLAHNPLPLWQPLLGVAAVAALSRALSRPIPGIGIGMPIFVAPLGAAIFALLVNASYSAPLAYISGTLGVLVGADLLRLADIRHMGTPFASIGGAGTFDGIFITGIVAVLLA